MTKRSLATVVILALVIPAIAEEKSELIGTQALPISLFPIDSDKYFRTKDLIGKKNIIISFFGTWCGPCRKEIPKLQELADSLNKDDYAFILICVSNIIPPGSKTAFREKIPSIRKFVNQLNIKMPVLFDKYNVVWRNYADLKNGTFPLTVVIDRKGKISYHHHSYKPGDEEKLKNHLKRL